MTATEIEQYLHEQIPLSAAIGVRVAEWGPAGVRLRAPLAPNLNHRDTAFGGSLSALGILAGWALIHFRLRAEGHAARLVIRRSETDYLRPVEEEFEAVATPPHPDQWTHFLRVFERRGRARIELAGELLAGAAVVGRYQGVYVALPAGPGPGESG